MSSDGSGSSSGPRPRRRWSRRIGNMELMVKSMLDLRQLESFAMPPSPIRTPTHDTLTDEQLGSTISLQTISAWVRDEDLHALVMPIFQSIHLSVYQSIIAFY